MCNVESILNKYPGKGHDNLIPILQDIQNEDGYLSKSSIVEVGKFLNMPSSRIYGVATFYNQFRFEPFGKYHIQVCRGTACHVLGSSTVAEELEKKLGVRAGSTTRDGLFSFEVVACIGACGLAPVIAINGEFFAKVTPEKMNKIIDDFKQKEDK